MGGNATPQGKGHSIAGGRNDSQLAYLLLVAGYLVVSTYHGRVGCFHSLDDMEAWITI